MTGVEAFPFKSTLHIRSAPAFNGAGEHLNITGFSCRTTMLAEALDGPSEALSLAAPPGAFANAIAVNLAEVEPAATVTLDGTDRVGESEEPVSPARSIVAPLPGAAADKVTMQSVAPPGIRSVSAQFRVETASEAGGGLTVIVVAFAMVFSVPVIVVTEVAVTRPTVALKPAEDDPGGIVTAAGTTTAAELLANRTARLATAVAVPVGAAILVKVTAHGTTAPAVADEAPQVTDASAGGPGRSVTEVDTEDPFQDAPIATVVEALTSPVVAANDTLELPAGTTTEAGVVTAALFGEIATDAPPAGAACESVAVQAVAPGETSDAGLQASDVRDPGAATVTEPAVAVVAMPEPMSEAVTAPVTVTGTGVLEGAAANSRMTFATTPLGMTFEFIPTSKHMMEPALGEQYRVFPAEVAAALAVTVTAVTSVVA